MKKILFFAALMLGMVSCQTGPEGLDVIVGGEQEVMLNVSLPESTRSASSTGFDFTNFESNENYDLRFILEIAYNETVVRTVKTSKTTSATFPVRLAPGRNYTFTVWADLVEENTEAADLHYNILDNAQDNVSALSNITFKSWTPNVEARDAYTYTDTFKFGENPEKLKMTLTRPFAKVRVVATDIADVTKFGIKPESATVAYTTDLYTAFNAVKGTVITTETETKSHSFVYADVDTYEATGSEQLTVFADYIFVPNDGTVQFNLDVYADEAHGGLIKSNSFNTAIPVEKNKVTSIVGDVLTEGGNVSITVDGALGQKETINYVDNAESLQEIINNSEDGESVNITLGGNINLNDLLNAGILATRAQATAGLVIPANKTIVLDLKGYTISYSTDTWNKHMIENHGDLTVKGEGAVAFTFTGDPDTSNSKGNYAIVNNGVLTIDGATVTTKASKVAEGDKFSHALYTIQMSNDGALTLESGNIINYNGYAIRQFGASDITINGGVVKGARALWIQLPGSDANVAPEVNVTVNGGTLIGTGETGYKLAIYSYSYGNDMANVNIAVTAGTIEGDIALTGGNNKTHIETLAITGGTLNDVYSYGDEKKAAEAITITGGTFSNITPLAYLNTANEVVTLNSNVENAAPVNFAGEGTLNLNGKIVSAYDDATAGYALITNNGNLTITGEGTLKITGAANNREWNAYSSVISNATNGTLVVDKDVTIEHLGGTNMAYGIDILTNGNIGDSQATVYGTVQSKYRAIRQFLNSDSKLNTLIVKEGAVINSTGGNKAIWMQDPSKKANMGKLVVESGAHVHSVYLDVTEGSTEWPVEVSVAASSLTDQSENKGIYTDNIPAGYAVVNENGIWTVSYTCAAKIGNTEYNSLQAAIEAVEEGETIVMQRDLNITTPAYGQNALNHAKAVSFTLDLNGKTLSADTGNSVFRYNITQTSATSNITVTFKNGTITSGDKTWCTVMAAGLSKDVKAIFNLENLTINASKAGDLAVKAWDYAVINANNVTVNATKCAGGFYAVGGEVVLTNCTVNQKGLYTAPYLSMAVAVSNGGKATVNSGNYTAEPTAASEGNNQGTSHGSWCAGVMNSGGELIINGGTFANGNFGDDALATAARGLIFGDTASKIVINDGNFNALKTVIDYQNNLGVQPNPNIVINGGNFSANPAVVTSYGGVVLAEGKVAAQGADGRWTLVDGVMDEAGLKAAFEQGGNIILGADITVSDPVTLAQGKNVVLDLNGKTLAAKDVANKYAIDNCGTLTIKGNGTINARGIYNGYNGGSSISTAKLTIENGTFNAMGTNGGACVYNYGTVDINSGTFESNGGYALNNQSSAVMTIDNASVRGGIYNSGATLTINANVYQHISGRHAIYNWESNITINGGEFDSESGNELILADGQNATVVINNGVFKKTAKSWLFGAATNKNISFIINGGVHYGYVNMPEMTVDTIRPYGDPIVVAGGSYNFNPTNWLAEGKTATQNTQGMWEVK